MSGDSGSQGGCMSNRYTHKQTNTQIQNGESASQKGCSSNKIQIRNLFLLSKPPDVKDPHPIGNIFLRFQFPMHGNLESGDRDPDMNTHGPQHITPES